MRIDSLLLHPLTVHFPVALLSVSVLWDGVGLWTGTSLWWTMSFWTLVVGLVTSLPALVTGFVEYADAALDPPSEETVTRHMILVGSAVTAFLVSLLFRGGSAVPEGGLRIGALFCSLMGLGLLVAGGHVGARLVYQYGIGQDRFPSPQ